MLLVIIPSAAAAAAAAATTITVDLIHRDSPLSPLYTANDTLYDRLHASFLRSISRSHVAAAVNFQTEVIPSGGEYFMNLSIGTPPFQLLAIADTGSDLTWVQSKPCDQCYHQKSPIFDPSNSSTLRKLPCGVHPCNSLDDTARSCHDGTCGYTYAYGDHSYTTGFLATDTFTISSAAIQNVAFGCGTRNGGTFDEAGSGIVGLGGGALSFVSQLGDKIGNKFSYCLVPLENKSTSATSRIVFGDDPLLTSNDAVSVTTNLVNKDPSTYYYLTLEAITVGRKKLLYSKTTSYESSSAAAVEEGNIIIDSGTTLTFLEAEFYASLEAALVKEIKMERANDAKSVFGLCFKTGGGGGGDVKLPSMKVHFKGGAEVELKPVNTFVRAEEKLICLTMVPTKDVGIFGNLAQLNFVVGYDLGKRTVSFLPADCSKH
ncbi:Probable aspartic protease At2g35615 [Linum perenne]